MTAGRLLIILGIVFVVLGMLWPLVTVFNVAGRQQAPSAH